MRASQEKTVYFVRHGQSVDNALPVFQSAGSPLSKKGISQAERIAERLATAPFEALIASPLQRAKETAERIARKASKEIIVSDLFVERIKPDELDGKPWDDADAVGMWRAWEETLYSPGPVRVSNGENYDDTIARVDRALAFLLSRPESTLAVVTHGYFLRAILARVLLGDAVTGATLKRFQERISVENTGITILRYADAFEEDFAWRLWTLNDHAHVAGT